MLLSNTNGQSLIGKKLVSINKKAKSIKTDRLGNLYIIQDAKIIMYNKSGDSLRAFNSKKYGEITYIDVTDPYKILVFFKDYNLLLFLDNYLSENGPTIDLQELGYDQVSFACQSRAPGIWVFDPLRQKVLRLDESFKEIHESINLAQWFSQKIEPNFMLEFNNQLFLFDAEKNQLLQFDHFATFQKKLQLEAEIPSQILPGFVHYLSAEEMCKKDLLLGEKNCAIKPKSTLKNLLIERGRIYLHYPNSVDIHLAN